MQAEERERERESARYNEKLAVFITCGEVGIASVLGTGEEREIRRPHCRRRKCMNLSEQSRLSAPGTCRAGWGRMPEGTGWWREPGRDLNGPPHSTALPVLLLVAEVKGVPSPCSRRVGIRQGS